MQANVTKAERKANLSKMCKDRLAKIQKAGWGFVTGKTWQAEKKAGLVNRNNLVEY